MNMKPEAAKGGHPYSYSFHSEKNDVPCFRCFLCAKDAFHEHARRARRAPKAGQGRASNRALQALAALGRTLGPRRFSTLKSAAFLWA